MPDSSPATWPHYAREIIAHAIVGTRPDRPGSGGVAASGGAPFRGTDILDLPLPDGADRAHSGVFVTLRIGKQLRGCMGTLDPSLALTAAVRHAATSAALHDPRFRAVTASELPEISIEVSILTPPHPMNSLDDLGLGRHGIIVQSGPRRGLFLPKVATDHNMDKETFLTRCCTEKAGLPADAWRSPGTEVLLFEAEVFQEA